MTLNLIETLKTSTCSPKHTNTTNIHLLNFNCTTVSKNPYFQNVQIQNNSAFYADLNGIIYILCWRQHNLTRSFFCEYYRFEYPFQIRLALKWSSTSLQWRTTNFLKVSDALKFWRFCNGLLPQRPPRRPRDSFLMICWILPSLILNDFQCLLCVTLKNSIIEN